jgi:hypothetical protein
MCTVFCTLSGTCVAICYCICSAMSMKCEDVRTAVQFRPDSGLCSKMQGRTTRAGRRGGGRRGGATVACLSVLVTTKANQLLARGTLGHARHVQEHV